MDLLRGYSSHVGGIARNDIVEVEYRFRATPCQIASGTSSNLFRAIQRSDLYLWTLSRYSRRVNGIARPDVVGVEYGFRATPSKTDSGNS